MISYVTVYIVLLAVLIFLGYRFQDIKNFVVPMIVLEKLPGPVARNKFLGNGVLFYNKSPDRMFNVLRKWSLDFYPINKMKMFPFCTASILCPEDCEKVLGNPVHASKSMLYKLLQPWLREGLLTSNGEKWQHRRKILTPAFHFSILQQFVQVFNGETAKVIEILREDSKENPVLNVHRYTEQYTLQTIAETAMGTKLTGKTRKELEYKQAILNLGEVLLYKLLHPWIPLLERIFIRTEWYQRETRPLKVLHAFTSEVIREREKNFTGIPVLQEEAEDDVYQSKKRLAMLDLMLEAKKRDRTIDDEGIREEVDTFMFEGHDTTAVALTYLLLTLANEAAVQREVREEIRSVVGNCQPEYKLLQDLNYTERCIKECLRLYPSVPFISRISGEEVVTSTGHVIPKGMNIHVHIYDMHRNPDIYPQPDRFDPDRFLQDNLKERHPFAYLPFSAGPRNCIGQRFALLELKAALCGILRKFTLEPIDTPQDLIFTSDLVLRTKNGIRIKFVPLH